MVQPDNAPVLTLEEWAALSEQRPDYLALYQDELGDPRVQGEIVGKHELDGHWLYFILPVEKITRDTAR